MPRPDRTLTSRHECKYFVPAGTLPALRALSRPFVQLDEFARRAPTRRYTLSSLYLDGPTLPLYRQTIEGHRNRFKLRIRSYSDDPAAPVYCEVKKRAERVVLKVRVPLERRVAEELLSGRPRVAASDPRVAEFLASSSNVEAVPSLRVRYEREAYESKALDPVRLTIDTAVSFARFDPAAPLSLSGAGWSPTPVEGAIVEIKFVDRCPSWVTRIVDELQLWRESIPKYVLSVDAALSKGWKGPSRASWLSANPAPLHRAD